MSLQDSPYRRVVEPKLPVDARQRATLFVEADRCAGLPVGHAPLLARHASRIDQPDDRVAEMLYCLPSAAAPSPAA